MRRLFAAAFLLTAAWLSADTTVLAQSPGPVGFISPPKPFDDVVRPPTTSPYLNLLNNQGRGQLPNYFTFVRPQLQQQAAIRDQRREISQLQRAFDAAARSPERTGAATTIRPTGYAARFQYFSHFYPQPRQ